MLNVIACYLYVSLIVVSKVQAYPPVWAINIRLFKRAKYSSKYFSLPVTSTWIWYMLPSIKAYIKSEAFKTLYLESAQAGDQTQDHLSFSSFILSYFVAEPHWLPRLNSLMESVKCFVECHSLLLSHQTGGQWYSDTSPFSIPWRERQSEAERERQREKERER